MTPARAAGVRAEGITTDYTDCTDEEASPDPDCGIALEIEEPKRLTEVGNGALCAGEPTGGPNEPATGKEAGRTETTAFEN
jgi:hypothetical protein